MMTEEEAADECERLRHEADPRTRIAELEEENAMLVAAIEAMRQRFGEFAYDAQTIRRMPIRDLATMKK